MNEAKWNILFLQCQDRLLRIDFECLHVCKSPVGHYIVMSKLQTITIMPKFVEIIQLPLFDFGSGWMFLVYFTSNAFKTSVTHCPGGGIEDQI